MRQLFALGSNAYAGHELWSCQFNGPSLYFNAEEEPECREGEPQQACSVYRQNQNRLSLHLPKASETSSLLSQVETLDKQVILTCRWGTRLLCIENLIYQALFNILQSGG